MGSSKKNKDRDKKKKKRDRDKHRHHHKHKKHKKAKSPSLSLSDFSVSDIEFPDDNVEISRKDEKRSRYQSPPPAPVISKKSPLPTENERFYPTESLNDDAPSGNKEVLSLSIEETNKIRAKLGLKPLSTSNEALPIEENENTYKPGEEIHKPAESIRDKLQIEKLREKIAVQREKRKQKQALARVKGLGESDEDEESALGWVHKSRKIQKDRKEAEKRNKQLEELDAQFGIGDLVEEEMSYRKKHLYDTKHLSGLKVEHDSSRFSDGHSTILTLKDSTILDGGEDTLVNINIMDDERYEKNVKTKKRKNDDIEYEAPEIDEFGNIVQQSLLTKYDEEIGGEKRKSFRLGSRGEAVQESIGPSSTKQKMAKLRKLTNLTMPEFQLATEYLNPDEVVSFKKRKKKKKKKLTADDLVPLPETEDDYGSRGNRSVNNNFDTEENIKDPFVEKQRVKTLKELMNEDDDIPIKMEVDDDEKNNEESDNENDDIELQEALNRSRRAKLADLQSKKLSTDRLLDVVMDNRGDDLSPGKVDMTLNITDEFCRTLGDIPTYGLSGNRADEDNTMLQSSPQHLGDSKETQGAWEEVHIEDTKVEISNERSIPILEEEPDTGKGVANALQLAMKKGYLEKGNVKKTANATLQHLRAIHYSIEDKAVDEERRGGGRGDRYMGPVMDFREKDTYKPDVKLEYVDDEGRKLNAKEAFRYLSHRFHGKGSGKNKLEKRMKKWKEELLMKHMSSSDTPLQTLERQKEKQKQLGSAYLVLSGSKPQESLEVKK